MKFREREVGEYLHHVDRGHRATLQTTGGERHVARHLNFAGDVWPQNSHERRNVYMVPGVELHPQTFELLETFDRYVDVWRDCRKGRDF